MDSKLPRGISGCSNIELEVLGSVDVRGTVEGHRENGDESHLHTSPATETDVQYIGLVPAPGRVGISIEANIYNVMLN